MRNKKYISTGMALAMVLSLVAVAPALAADSTTVNGQGATGIQMGARGRFGGGFEGGARGQKMMQPGVTGTVSSISGNSLVVSGRLLSIPTFAQGVPQNNVAQSYSIDATNAKVTKDNVASTVSGIAVGDTVFVQGTVSGTNVTATTIRDGKMMRGFGFGKEGDKNDTSEKDKTARVAPAALSIVGNGQPVVAGTIAAMSGSSITITNKSNVTYSVDASSAKVAVEGVVSPTLSNLKVGDSVVIQGTVNGTSITASSIIDGTRPASATNPTGTGKVVQPRMGFFGGIGNFFTKMFGF